MAHVHEHHQLLPCLHCHPQSYIHMVQHLIERCMCFQMTMEDCIHALSKHAGIQPAVTLTVWRELLKENRSFFRAYNHVVSSPRQWQNSSTNLENRSDQRMSRGGGGGGRRRRQQRR